MKHLQFKNDQKLRIIPISENILFDCYYQYYFYKENLLFFHDTPDFINTYNNKNVQRNTLYFAHVLYKDELYIIHFGYTIKKKIDEFINETSYIPINFLYNSVYLNIYIRDDYGFNNYDNSVITYETYKEKPSYTNDYFLSDDYKLLSNFYNNYINSKKIDYNKNILEILNDHNLIKPEYKYLLRNIKIDEIRKNKKETTENELWEKIESSIKYDDIIDLGLTVDQEQNKVKQIMVNGYLFELRLIDKIV